MKKLPIGIQSIKKILDKGEYLYIDKTGFIKNLIDEGIPHYFTSRPRRFGKSLFVSTLEEVFKGNRELFKGLKIYNSDYDWQQYPVLHFDFAQILNTTPQHLETGLKESLQDSAQFYEISVSGASSQSILKRLIIELAKKNRVVVLVDEYDNAIINNLKNPEIAEKNRDLLKAFFGTLKSLDQYLKFTFVTGVTKFSQVSLFSGPNNLTDITMEPKYADIMGYTETELNQYFNKHIEDISRKKNQKERKIAKEEVIKQVRIWYNGYRFSEKDLSVYNPYSTLRFFSSQRAESYWYSTGTPSFLIDEVKKHPQSVVPLSGISSLKSTLSDISRLDKINLAALMFQTGYLTIQHYNPEENSYSLDFPNKEVKEAFFNSLLQEFTEIDPLEVSRSAKELKKELENFDLASFIHKINAHFAKIPYYLFTGAKEGFYQAVFFTFLEKSEIRTITEMATNIGRIDLMTKIGDTICIFELKLNQSADIALTQAETKKYKQRFYQSAKHTLVVGVNFSSQSRNINEWQGKKYASNGNLIREYSSNDSTI